MPGRALGQLFILLQYQALAQRLKVMVRKAESLVKLTRMPGAPGERSWSKEVLPVDHAQKVLPVGHTQRIYL